jgi:hypothetical protein
MQIGRFMLVPMISANDPDSTYQAPGTKSAPLYFVYVRRIVEGGGSGPGEAGANETVSQVVHRCAQF